jgi:hypothetical protein
MTIKKSDFLLNFMMFCLGDTVGRRIGDPYLMRHLAAKSADLMLVNLPQFFFHLSTFTFLILFCLPYFASRTCTMSHLGVLLEIWIFVIQ